MVALRVDPMPVQTNDAWEAKRRSRSELLLRRAGRAVLAGVLRPYERLRCLRLATPLGPIKAFDSGHGRNENAELLSQGA